MFIARRIIPKNKLLTNFICTSNILHCDEPKDGTEKKTEIPNSPQKAINKLKSTASKPRFKNPKKTYLGISENSVKNVAKEFTGDINKTSEEILNYLSEMEVSKDPLRSHLLSKDFPMMPLSNSMMEKKGFSFTSVSDTEPQVKLKIWEDLEAEELKFLTKVSPSNCFEEMIAWTEEGKLWHFPIDNDQGLEKEAEISFTEHIFMEKHLEPWCPKKGPLRKFMELVLIGLAKNHIYTVEEKKAHIDWFRKYFEEKKKLLQELGAMGSVKEPKIEASTSEEKP